MTAKRLNCLLWTVTSLCSIGIILLIVEAICVKPSMKSNASNMHVKLADNNRELPLNTINVLELEQLARLDLRQPLHSAATLPAPAPAPIPPLNIHLSGTIFEPGHCRAMIQQSDGSVRLKAIGELVGEARIVDIQKESIRVEYFGQSEVLTVTKESGN